MFAIKVDPLNLEAQNQAKNIPMVFPDPKKLWGKSVQGFLSYKQTNRDYNFTCDECPTPINSFSSVPIQVKPLVYSDTTRSRTKRSSILYRPDTLKSRAGDSSILYRPDTLELKLEIPQYCIVQIHLNLELEIPQYCIVQIHLNT